MNEQEAKKLYNALIGKGYSVSDLGDESTFLSHMADGASRKELYDYVSGRGDFRIGSYNDYETRLGGQAQEQDTAQDAEQPILPRYSSPYLEPKPMTPVEEAPQIKPAQPSSNTFTAAEAGQMRADSEPQKKPIGAAAWASPGAMASYGPMPEQENNSEGELTEEQRKAVAERQGVIEELRSSIGKQRGADTVKGPSKPIGAAAWASPGAMASSQAQRGEQSSTLQAAQMLVDMAGRTNKALTDLHRSDGFFDLNNVTNFARGAKDTALDPRTWDMGLGQLQIATALSAVKDKVDAGEPLNEAEQTLLAATMLNQEVQSEGSEYLPHGYKAGQTTVQMAPFMAQLALVPEGGAASVLTRKAVDKFGKAGLKSMAARAASKIAGDVVTSAGLASTAQGASTAADILDRMNGYVVEDENGNYKFVDGKNIGQAVYEGLTAATIENFTEMALEGTGMRTWTGKGLNKLTGGRVAKMLEKMDRSDFYRGLSKFNNRVRWGGNIEEVAEEELGIVLNSLFNTGDAKLSDLTDIEQQIDIALGVGIFGSAMNAVQLGGYVWEQNKYGKKLDSADARAEALIGDSWGGIKQQIDNAGEKDIKSVLANAYMNPDLSVEQKRAILEYGVAKNQKDYYNVGLQIAREGMSDFVGAGFDAYQMGQELQGAQRNDAGRQAADTFTNLASTPEGLKYAMGLQDLFQGRVDEKQLNDFFATVPDNLKPAVTEFYAALCTTQGVRSAAHEQAEKDIAKFDADVDHATVTGENGVGLVTTAILDGKQVYVIDDNGSTAVVEDADGRRPVASKALSDKETHYPNEYKENYRNAVTKSVDDEIDFVLHHNEKTELPQQGTELHRLGEKGQENLLVTAVDPQTSTVSYVPATFDAQTGQNVPQQGAQVQQMTTDEALAMQDQWWDYDSPEAQQEAQTEAATMTQQSGQAGQETNPASQLTAGQTIELTIDGQRVEATVQTPDQGDGRVTIELEGEDGSTLVKEYSAGALSAMMQSPEEENGLNGENGLNVSDESNEPQGPAHPEWRAKDGDYDRKLMEASGDAEGVAKAFTDEFGDEAKSIATEYANIASKEAKKEKDPIRRRRKQTVVSFWDDVRSRIEGPVGGQTPVTEATSGSATEQRRQAAMQISEEAQQNFPQITQRWAGAPKVEGRKTLYIMPDGTQIKGRYVLTESGAYTPSHDPHTFKPNEGFPVTEQGQTANSRDYEHSPEAQATVIANGQSYNGNALQDAIVVSEDGVVYSGNNRTMSGMLAAERGTDQAYREALEARAEEYGFTPEDIVSMTHPRVVFVADAGQGLDYTPNTFDRFNTQREKGESGTEQAVRLGKTLDDDTFNRLNGVIQGFEKLTNLYQSANGCREVVSILQQAGIITQGNRVNYIDNNGLLTEQGKQALENALIGKVFSDNEDAVRRLSAMPAVRRRVIEAMNEIAANRRLGEYSLSDELSDAITLLYEAGQSGQSLNDFYNQGDFTRNVQELYSAEVYMLATLLNGQKTRELRDALRSYNAQARAQIEDVTPMFGSKDRHELVNEIIEALGYEARRQEPQQRSVGEQSNNAETGNDGGARGQSDLAQTEKVESYKLSDEVDENGRQFVMSPDGNIVFGQIGEETGLQAAPILLSEGQITNPETNDGYGLVHIEARHGDQIRKAGYKSVVDFISEVAKNYEVIKEGRDRDGNQTYMLQLTDKHNNTLMVELSGDGTYWNVNTAGIFKTSYGANRREVYNRHTTVKQSAETAEVSLSGEQSGTTPSTRMNTSTTSAGKGTEISGTEQEKEEKSVENSASYSVTPKKYTTKKGKVLDMQLVKFDKELDAETQRKANALARKQAGWWSREDGGFLLRDEESANTFARTVMDEEALEEEQPMSLQDMATASEQQAGNEAATVLQQRRPDAEQTEQQQAEQPKRLVSDARMEELKARMREKLRGQMNMGIDPEILAIGTEIAVGHIERGLTKFASYAKAMIEDLGDAIRPYLKAFYNAVRDMPEAEDYVGQMDSYEDVRQFDVLSLSGETAERPVPTVFESAEQIVAERRAEKEAEQAKQQLTEQRNDGRKAQSAGVALDGTPLRPLTEADLEARDAKFYYQGKRVYILAVMRQGEQVSATQFSVPRIGSIYLTNGQSVKPEDLMVADESKTPVSKAEVQKAIEDSKKSRKERNTKKKDVSLQQEPDLFSSFGEDKTNVESQKESNNGHARSNAVRPEGLPADRTYRGEQRLRTDGEKPGQESGRPDGRGTQGSVGEVRRGLLERLRPNEQLNREETERPANPKNLNNNHAERGIDYAPKGVDARIDANIKAIELMQQLVESGVPATTEQKEILRRFSGWGGLGKAFEGDTARRLRELLGEEAYQQAVMSRNSAYYTPANVIDRLWDIARAMGFKGGNVLEGSAGIGNILGLMPTDMSERSDIQAVEIDQTTGNILKLLYPDAKVDIQGFEATEVENGSVDLAITNVPFVTGLRVNDTTGDKDLSRKFRDIHDFCIAKNIRKLKEGGIGIFITSSGTLDNSARLREWIIQEGGADVVGAFRLNNETFGGTGATSDIIIVRKRVNGKKSPHAIDVLSTTGERTAEYDTGETKKVRGEEVPVIKSLSMDYNKYFVEHPEMMGGEMYFGFEKGDTFRPTSKALYPTSDKNQAQMLGEWANSFADKDWEVIPTGENPAAPTNVYEALGEDVKEGSLVVNENGTLCVAQRGRAVPLAVNANKVKGHTKVECFNAYKHIKDVLADLLAYQTENEGDEGLQPRIDALNKAYDQFVKTYGHLHKNTAISFLKNDVDFANIQALESFKEMGDGKGGLKQEYGKTDIFEKRVVEKEKDPAPYNVKDGIIASLYVHGRIDVPWIAATLSQHRGQPITEEQVKEEIIKSGLGFENPTTRQMEVSYEYLSGNVREKLAQAQTNNTDGRYDANVKALEAVVPLNIPAHLIDFNIGSSWIDPKLYEEYVKDKTDVDVTFTPAGGTWFMKTPYYVGEQKNRAMGITSQLLHKTIMGTQLIEAAMQNKTITVSETRKKWDGSTETVVDKEATQACANKIDEIRADFKDWAKAKMQSDPAMSERIERTYNEMFNNYVPKEIPEEFVPKYFGGASHNVELRPHQGKAVVRGTTQPLLLAHEVGSGKTYTLISTAMEMRRLGTARKPMIVVQNSTVGQVVESAKELYPNAKVLTIEDTDRTAEGRKNFYAKIKYNDWDMIVVPQSVFERIPDSEERQMKFVQDKIEEKMLVLEQMKDADPQGQSAIVRQAEREISKLEEELADLTDNISSKRKERDEKREAVTRQNAEVKALEMLDRQTDDVEDFDDMGIDALLVDEAHEYKHLGFATAMQRGVKGVDPSYSKKAQGVYLKTQAVMEKNNGRNVIFATGTPISNTAAEIWTFMRYLMPADTMKEYGIYYFDDFVRNFGNLTQMLEFTTSGKFKENNRFAGYVNLPELVRIWASITDTVLNEDVERQRIERGEESKLPELEGGKATDIYLPQTHALRSVMKYVKSELDKYDKMSGKEKKENSHIPLTMYGIAKAAAVDARLVVSDAADEPKSKTNEAVRQTLRSLEDSKSYSGTVALFADNYQNKKSGFNLYEDIRQKLIDNGVPAEQIAIMKSGMTIKKKQEIFDKVNRGEIRVILGSTFTLGTGVNIQERLHTLIHLDAPNRPMDYTQRNGRIVRQGNIHKDMNKPVRVLRFGVEDSLDVTAYQRLKTKGAIADSIMNGKQMMSNSMENRALEEEEDVFGDTVAQLSGSEYAMLKNQAEKDVRKYEAKKKQYEADQTYCHNEIPRLQGQIKGWEKFKDEAQHALDVLAQKKDAPLTIAVGNQSFDSLDGMADYLKEFNKKVKETENALRDKPSMQTQTRKLTVTVNGIDFVFTTELNIMTQSQQGELFTAIRRKMTYSCEALGMEDVPVRQSLLREGLEDVVNNVISGNIFRERIEVADRNLARDEKSLEQVKERSGKPFAYETELKQAHERYDEYAEKMKKELEEKEKKYADMDASVEAVEDVTEAEEDEEDESSDEGLRFREEEDNEEESENTLNNRGGEPSNKINSVSLPQNTTGNEQRSVESPHTEGRSSNGKDEGATLLLQRCFVKPDENGQSSRPKERLLAELEKKSRDSGYWIADINARTASDIGAGGENEVYQSKDGSSVIKLNNLAYLRDNAADFTDFINRIEAHNELFPDVPLRIIGFAENSRGEISVALEQPLVKNAREATEEEIDEAMEEMGFYEDITGALSDDSGRYAISDVKPNNVLVDEEGNLHFVDVIAHDDRLPGRMMKPRKPVLREAQLNENLQEGRSAETRRPTSKNRQAYLERTARHIEQAAKDLVEKLNLKGRTVLVTDAEKAGSNVKRTLRKHPRAKGWYDSNTGMIYIILPNHGSVNDVLQTILHESVAHHGLRELFGNKFNEFLHKVYVNADNEVRSAINRLAEKHGWDIVEATEEYLASLAEDTNFEKAERSGWWAKIKAAFLRALRDIVGDKYFGYELGNNELRYILWRSYQNLANPGRYRNPFAEAEDIAMQNKLGVGRYAKERDRILSTGKTDSRGQRAAEETGKILFREGDEIGEHLQGLATKYGLKGTAMTVCVGGQEDIESLKPFLDERVIATIESYYDIPDLEGFYLPERDLVIVYTNKTKNKENAEIAWLHEQTHAVVYKLGLEGYGPVAVAWLESNRPDMLDHIKDNYSEDEWEGEAMAFFTQHLLERYDLDKFMTKNFVGEPEMTTFVHELQNGLKNGRQKENSENKGTDSQNPEQRTERSSLRGRTGLLTDRGADNKNVQESELQRRRGEEVRPSDNSGTGIERVQKAISFTPRDQAIVADQYEKAIGRSGHQFREAVQDSMLSLRTAMEQIAGKKVEDIPGFENAYFAENRLSSLNLAEQDEYTRLYMNPLLSAVAQLTDSKDEARAELIDYMMAKHGLERNVVLAQRDFDEYQVKHPRGQKTLADFREKDYSGLTALTGAGDVAAAEAVAQQMVADYEAAHDTGLISDLWARTNGATGYTLEKMRNSGLMSEERYQEISGMFDNYIPLRGWDETRGEDVYGYLTGKGSAYTGRIDKRAEGRSSKADDPLAFIASMADSAIMQGNKNLMKQRFLNFVWNHPSDLVSVDDLWLRYDEVNDEWIPVFPDIPDNASAADVAQIVKDFREHMEALAQAEPDNYKHGKDAINLPYRVLPDAKKEHQVIVKLRGKSYVITVNGNPRLAQALNGMTNPDSKSTGIVHKLGNITQTLNRELSALYTTRNPDFVLGNFIRDMLYANTMVWLKEDPAYARRFHRNIGKLAFHNGKPALLTLLWKYEHGTLDTSNYQERMFSLFMKNGGETGYASVKNLEKHKKAISDRIKREGNPARNTWGQLNETLDLVGRAVENTARFAAFVTSMEAGRGIDRAVYDAKEITVNFNKKGSGDTFLSVNGQTKLGNLGSVVGGLGRMSYVFWNAGIQGTTNFLRAAKRNPAKFTAASAITFSLGLGIPLLCKLIASCVGDDDDYYDLPEYVRRSNICIKLGGKHNYLTIALPLELRGIYGMGELATSVLSKAERYSADKLALEMAGQISQILPLDPLEGGEFNWSTYAPSSLKPTVEAISNRSWTGLPIYKDNPWNQKDPEWTKAYSNTPGFLVTATKWLNKTTGGDEAKSGMVDLNPAQIYYLLNGYLGGAWSFPMKLEQTLVEAPLTDKDFEWRNTPLANRVIRATDQRAHEKAVKNDYYSYKEEMDEVARLENRYKKPSPESLEEFAQKLIALRNSTEYKMYQQWKNQNKKLKKLKDKAEEPTATSAEGEAYQKAMEELVEKMREMEEGE